MRVTLLDLASDDLESALLDGRVHVSVMVKPGSRPQPGILFEEIVRYPLRIAVARDPTREKAAALLVLLARARGLPKERREGALVNFGKIADFDMPHVFPLTYKQAF